MKNKPNSARYIITSALIASLYTALTLVSSAFGLAYSGLQFRLSEALNILAAFTPAAIPGLTIGCIISNLTSPFGIIDIVLGATATLISALSISAISKMKTKYVPVIMSIPPAVLNGFVVGLETVLFATDNAGFSLFLISSAQVFVSEIVICCLLGIPLYNLLKSKFNNIF